MKICLGFLFAELTRDVSLNSIDFGSYPTMVGIHVIYLLFFFLVRKIDVMLEQENCMEFIKIY